MKRSIIALTTLITATLALSSVAHANNQAYQQEKKLVALNPIPPVLVGKWTGTGGIADQITFNSNGSFIRATSSYSVFHCGIGRIIASRGTFTVNGSNINFFPKDAALRTYNTCTQAILSQTSVPVGPHTSFAHLQNNGRQLVLKEDGSSRSYTYQKSSR